MISLFSQNLKYNTNEPTHKTETVIDRKETYGHQKGKGWVTDKLGVLD